MLSRTSCEPPNRPDDSRLSITMPVTALSSRAPRGADRAVDLRDSRACRVRSAPTATGPETSISSTPVSRHKVSAGAVVAQLRQHRRARQPLADIARAADRRQPRLRPADRPALADRDRAQRRIAAVEPRVQADVDRPRGEDQARPGSGRGSADWPRRSAPRRPRRSGSARCPRRCRRGRAAASRCRARSSGIASSSGVDLGAWSPNRPETAGVAAGEAEPGRRQPPAVGLAGQHGRLGQLDRPPVERAAAGHAGSGPARRRRRCRRRSRGRACRRSGPGPGRRRRAARLRRRDWRSTAAPGSARARPAGPRCEVPAGSSRTTPSIVPRRITIGGGPAKRALSALRLTRDPLDAAATASNSEPPVEPAAGDVEPAGEAARIGAQRAGRPRARDVERRDLDDRRLARAAAGSRRCR